MKKIVPFKNEIPFKTKIGEITSISLEHTLHKEGTSVVGEFVISGAYKLDSNSDNESFNYEIPCEISLDEHYDISHALIDINDFYYEILNDNKLVVNIEVVIDKIVENLVNVEKQVITIDANDIDKEETSSSVELLDSVRDSSSDNVIETLASDCNSQDEYVTYHIHIVREKDTINTILEKYHVDNEMLSLYNDVTEIKIGDKLLIPTNEN